jgi:hypothetical protein
MSSHCKEYVRYCIKGTLSFMSAEYYFLCITVYYTYMSHAAIKKTVTQKCHKTCGHISGVMPSYQYNAKQNYPAQYEGNE